MAKVYTPVEGYTGLIAGVSFTNGMGETEDKWLIQWFRSKGYKVIQEEINLKDFTVKELKEIAKDKGMVGYSNMTKDELIKSLKG